MYPQNPFAEPMPSFQLPAEVPADEPNAGTLVSVCFNQDWLGLILGALQQLAQDTNWNTTDETALALAQARAQTLFDMFIRGWCDMTSGMITFFAGETAPDGWLPCDGSAVSRACYASLFAVLGTAFGAGDGTTTFNLPDLGGRVPIGIGQQSGGTLFNRADRGGEEKHQLTTAELAAHSHSDSGHMHSILTPVEFLALTGEEPVSIIPAVPSFTGSASANIQNTGSDTPHNNLPPYLSLLPIIKT